MKDWEDFRRSINSLDLPKDARALRHTSYRIIADWIGVGYTYPHDLMDAFVYIEDSIERSIDQFSGRSAELEAELLDSYNFHMQPFVRALNELKAFVETHKPNRATA